MIILASDNSKVLSKEIARLKNFKLVSYFSKNFPDGEIYIRLNENIEDNKILILTTLYPANEYIIKLLFLLERFSDKTISLVIPYLAYSRQHKEFLENELISAKLLATLIEKFNVEKLITVNVHSSEVKNFYKRINFINLSAFEEIIKFFEGKFNLVVLPDDEEDRVKEIKELSNNYGFEFFYLRKERDRYSGEIKTYLDNEVSVKNKSILLIDDMISTGNTIINAIKILKKLKANKIFVSCVHGLFLNNCYRKILRYNIVKSLVCTNSIENQFSKISLANLISQRI